MNKDNIKISIIGCGRVANHYKSILIEKVISGYELVSVCDIDIKKASAFAEYFKCEYFEKLEDLLINSNPQLLIVATPSGMHYEHSKIALNNNVHVLVEKPMTMVPSQAIELIELAKKLNLIYAVAFQNRLNPSIISLQNALNQDRFGKIVTTSIRLRWCRFQDYYNDGWHGTWENDGGVINQQAIHHVDVLNWLMGPIESVCATTANRLNNLEAEDTFVAILKFTNGSIGTIEATTAARPKDYEASISIIGEKGTVVVSGIALNKIETWNFIDKTPEDENVIELNSQEVPTGYGFSHTHILTSIFNSIKNNTKNPSVLCKDALSSTELIHALYKSVEVGGWIKIIDKPESSKLGKKSMI